LERKNLGTEDYTSWAEHQAAAEQAMIASFQGGLDGILADAVASHHFQALAGIERAMVVSPARSTGDVLTKLSAALSMARIEHDGEEMPLHWDLVASASSDLARLCGVSVDVGDGFAVRAGALPH
jgi:hypothetical protein